MLPGGHYGAGSSKHPRPTRTTAGPTRAVARWAAWHLSEIEGYTSYGITKGAMTFQEIPPNMQLPREVRLLAPAYRRVHEEAVTRLADLTEAQLDREMQFADRRMSIRDILWGAMLMHLIHHREQLSLLCRLAGGTSPGIYGPNREEMAAMRERMKTAKV